MSGGDVKTHQAIDLAPLSGRHAGALLALGGEDMDAPWPERSRSGVLAFVARAERLRARGLRHTFAVRHGRDLVGLAVLARDPATPDRAELGYWIGRPFRGRGYATAAARELVTRGFRRLRLDLVFAHCSDGNLASTRVLERLGFRPVTTTIDGRRRWELRRPL